ncbi:ATP-binding protein [Actinomadura sp. KC216]|uniref:ATP-binding protein n=1 Tax=Actinomadura sp. KC216 TaxID=2530370 RepID=UPI001053DE9E|nr:ATP-binding protein [Actinomadura sp. KC216]TDB76122.1 ATP-binding protein [Actinomadura sp. KC216]
MKSSTAGLTAETMADAMAGGDGADRAVAGTMPGWVWALPGGAGCAGHARRVLGDALASLDVPRDAIADAQLMVSELATNAHQHAGEHGPHELWLYLGEIETGDDDPDGEGGEGAPMDGAGGEVRCAVFDAFPDAALPGYSWTSGDCGRGLSIVRELSGGRWGMRRTRSRLGPSVRGKAVWFAVPGATASAALR